MLAEAAISNGGVWAGPLLLTMVGIGLGLARGRWVPWVQGACLTVAAILGAALLLPLNVLIPLVVLAALLAVTLVPSVYRRTREHTKSDADRVEAEAAFAQRRRGVPEFALNVKCDHRVQIVALIPGASGSGRLFHLPDVVITNSSPRGVSLLPSLAVEMQNDSYFLLEQKPDPAMPLGVLENVQFLSPPIDIDPAKSCRGDLGFVLHASVYEFFEDGDFEDKVKRTGGLPVFYLAWRDLVSGGELAHEVTHAHASLSRPSLTLDELLQQKDRIRAVLAPDPTAGKPLSEMTPYERLLRLHREGIFLAESSAIASSVEAILKSISEVSGWTLRVGQEIKNVAPDYLREWNHVSKEASRTGRGLATRLEVLESILSRLLANEKRPALSLN